MSERGGKERDKYIHRESGELWGVGGGRIMPETQLSITE